MANETTTGEEATRGVKHQNWFASFLKTKKGKVVAAIVGLIVVLAILFAVPITRYAVSGPFIHRDQIVHVADAANHKPVSGVTVSVDGRSATTDAKGDATLKDLAVGSHQLKIEKKYYESSTKSILVPLFSDPKIVAVDLKATGQPISLTVTNKITGQTLSGATLTASGVTATSDEKGTMTIVLPAKDSVVTGELKADSYNDRSIEVKTSADGSARSTAASLTPTGQIVFLSKRSGTIDIVRTNLDGTDRKVLIKGTGNESDRGTVLLSTTDWKYQMLEAEREDGNDALYLVNPSTGKLTLVDEGVQGYQLVGWSDHKFIYIAYRKNKQSWQDGVGALKVYDADNGKLSIKDETKASGSSDDDYIGQTFSDPYVIGDKVVYAKGWIWGYYIDPTDRKETTEIDELDLASGAISTVAQFSLKDASSVVSRLYEVGGIYFQLSPADYNKESSYYEYEDGKVFSVNVDNDKFYDSFYPTFLESPSEKQVFWYEPRDGKNALFTADVEGKNKQTLSLDSDYKPYGWYSDKYLLLSKGGSELYVTAANSPLSKTIIKVSDYHKPAQDIVGYGSGYGGL